MKALRTLKDLSFDPIEIKVREATNNDPVGASSTLMADIAQATHNYRLYAKLFAMLWKRLTDHEHILHVQKALILAEYLLRNGHERFVADCKKYHEDIKLLTKYRYFNKDREEVAHDVRFKAAIVYELLNNPEKLSAERKKAESMRGIRLQAVSSNDVQSQWSSVDKEKQAKERAEKQAKEAASKKEAERKRAPAKPKAAEAPAAAADPEDSDAEADAPEPAHTNIEDDPFGSPPSDPEPPKAVVKPKAAPAPAAAAKKPAAKPKPKPAAEPTEEEGGPRRPSGDATDDAFGAAIHSEHTSAPSKPAAAPAPAAAVAVQVKPSSEIVDPFNMFDVGMSAKPAAAAAPVDHSNVDLLTSSFGAASLQPANNTFVDVSSPPKKPAAAAPVRGQSNVEVPAAAKPAGAGNELWNIDGLVSVDDLTGARKKDEKKAVGSGVSMGEMNQLKAGLGNNSNFLDGFGVAPAPQPAAPAPRPGGGANFALSNNPFFAPAPSAAAPNPFMGLPMGGAAQGPARSTTPAASAASTSNPFADLGFG